jgi:beta-lactamase superfamily II metal-dependent hydrolase
MGEDEGYEVDFLSCGGGDAIAVRYGWPENYRVLIYDTPGKECGEAAVEHVRRHYGTNHVDYLVCSRPDVGRASGLTVVLENLTVGELWMHLPWNYSDEILRYFTDPRITDSEPLRQAMNAMFDLEDLAATKGVRMCAPFRGAQIGAFHVMSPDRRWYVHSLLPNFTKSTDESGKPASIANVETLSEDASTSAENESSVVLCGEIADRKILLTGDAGVRALTATANYAESAGVSLPRTLDFIQVPHHGDRNNVSPGVLDRLIGAAIDSPADKTRLIAFVSTAEDAERHPHKAVVNGFLRRRSAVVATRGRSLRHHFNMGARSGWGGDSCFPTP